MSSPYQPASCSRFSEPSVRPFQRTGTLTADSQPSDRISAWSGKAARMASASAQKRGSPASMTRAWNSPPGTMGLAPPGG